MRTAVITGITGQDGAYLAHHLVGQGYRVVGAAREQSLGASNLQLLGIRDQVEVMPVDLLSQRDVMQLFETVQPDEIYHLAAQSSLGLSFKEPGMTGEITGVASARILEAYRLAAPHARFIFASTAHIFGQAQTYPQSEETRIRPVSPYGAAKAYGHYLTGIYRDVYGLHASCAILYNHDSPLRPETFVTRKITMGVSRIKHGLQEELALSNLDVWLDCGYAGEYAEAMHLMTQQERADDYIIATGKMHLLRDFVESAFAYVGLEARDYVRVAPAFFRPVEETKLVGDASKAKKQLNWSARLCLPDMVELLLLSDLEIVKREKSNRSSTQIVLGV